MSTQDLYARVGVRDEGCDDNGEPLCAEPTRTEVAGDRWPALAMLSRIETIVRLPSHHIDTEGGE